MLAVAAMGFHHFGDDGQVHELRGFHEDVDVPGVLFKKLHLVVVVPKMFLDDGP
jgi:hypothetical protein